jgi:type III secretory pathway lipoprotein EscJ
MPDEKVTHEALEKEIDGAIDALTEGMMMLPMEEQVKMLIGLVVQFGSMLSEIRGITEANTKILARIVAQTKLGGYRVDRGEES